jgi:hypothetical protein
MGLSTEKKVYLTFDDGPTTQVTEWVLEKKLSTAPNYFLHWKKYRIPIYFEN